MEIQKCEYLEKGKSFLDEIKTSFIVFEGLSLMKNENLLKSSGHKLSHKKQQNSVVHVVLVSLSLTIKNFTRRSGVSMIDCEQVNAGLVVSSKGAGIHDLLKEKSLVLFFRKSDDRYSKSCHINIEN